MITQYIRERLHLLNDADYKKFNSSLMPTVPPETVIGVRTLALRALAREIAARPDCGEFLNALPHALFEENQLHAFIISAQKDFGEALRLTEQFLPYIDNWATCDQLTVKVFAKRTDELLPHVERWITDPHVYTVRYALRCLMMYYLDDNFDERYLALAASAQDTDYYIGMAQAWYFATALAKHWHETLPWVEQRRLDLFVHRMTIRKATESFRVSDEHKQILKAMRAHPDDGKS